MSSDTIIRVENLGKRYSLRHLRDQRYVALRDVLVEKATGLFRRSPKGRLGNGSLLRLSSSLLAPASISHLPSSTTSPALTSDLLPPPPDLRASKADYWALR